MVEQNPLFIRYITDQRGVSFGWSVKGLDQINPYTIPVFTPESKASVLSRGDKLVDAVHAQVLLFFNGPLSADLNIPQNYPYQFYEPDRDVPTYTGRLRESVSPK